MDRYEEALEKARVEYEKARKQGYTWLMDLLEGMFPELKESEDERIRRHLIDIVETYWGTTNDPGKAADLAWLEKQKELPTNDEMLRTLRTEYEKGVADTIAKYEQEEQTEELTIRLNGVMQEYVKAGKDEEEQEYRLKCYQLFWDALGDSEFFKQKEQKFTEKQDYSDLTDLERAIHRGFLVVGVENVPVTIIKETTQDCLAQMKQQKGANGNEKEIPNKQKPTEWSEEDEEMRGTCIDLLEHFPRPSGEVIGPWKDCIAWLKSLRPPQYCENCKLKRSIENWKPSDQ